MEDSTADIDELSGTLKLLDIDPAWVYEDNEVVLLNFSKEKLAVAILELPEHLRNKAKIYLDHIVALFENCSDRRGKKIVSREDAMEHHAEKILEQ